MPALFAVNVSEGSPITSNAIGNIIKLIIWHVNIQIKIIIKKTNWDWCITVHTHVSWVNPLVVLSTEWQSIP